MSNEDELPEEDLDEELDDGALEDFKDEALEEDEMM